MLESKKIVFIGAGGHFKSVLAVVKQLNDFSIEGVLDTALNRGDKIEDIEVLGNDDLIPELIKQHCLFLITIGQVNHSSTRGNVYDKLKELGARLATIVSPTACLADNVEIGEGTVVLNQVFVNSGVVIGDNCIINNKALLEHDVKIGNHSHISTSAVVNGEVIIGQRVMVGSNSTIIQCLRINDDSVVGAGAVVIRDVVAKSKVVGNPAVVK